MQKQSQWSIKNLLMLIFIAGAEKELLLHSAFFLVLSSLIKETLWLSGTVYEASRYTGGKRLFGLCTHEKEGPHTQGLELSNGLESDLLLWIPMPSFLQGGARNSSHAHPCCASNYSVEEDFACIFFFSYLLIFNNINNLLPTPKRPQPT